MSQPAPEGRRSRPKAPKCHTCGRRIHVPGGWSAGAAARRHYWKHHRDVMRPDEGKTKQ